MERRGVRLFVGSQQWRRNSRSKKEEKNNTLYALDCSRLGAGAHHRGLNTSVDGVGASASDSPPRLAFLSRSIDNTGAQPVAVLIGALCVASLASD